MRPKGLLSPLGSPPSSCSSGGAASSGSSASSSKAARPRRSERVMAAAEPVADDDLVVKWRERYAAVLGYDPADAALIAISDRDMHQLEHLLEAGCPPELALRIT